MAAGDAVVVGTNAFTEQHPRRRWVRNRGWVKVRSWLGPKDDTLIDALVAQLQALNVEEIDITEEHPTLITALVPSDADTVSSGLSDPNDSTEWSLEPFDLDKALGTHGQFNNSADSGQAIAAIDADLRADEETEFNS